MSTTADASTFAGWAILEVMGHRRLGGYVQEVQLAGAGFLRIDVPGDIRTTVDGNQTEVDAGTQYYPPTSVYCLTPCDEQVARSVAAQTWNRPVHILGLPRAVHADDELLSEIETYVETCLEEDLEETQPF